MKYNLTHPYSIAPEYSRPVAYFCMEYAIHQPLKIYSGGLGFLAGSQLRSAFELKQNFVAVGILWKFGYYDQVRKSDQTMDILFQEKVYGFLEKTNIRFTIRVAGHDVWVAVYYLPPEIFNTAPLFLLSTDVPENDYLAKTISYKLYDPNPETRIASAILLGAGGARLFEYLNWQPEVYHLNESHGLPLAFYLLNKSKSLADVREKLVFTNHTPEEGGNPRTDISLLDRMDFFCGVPVTEVKETLKMQSGLLDHTLASLRMAGIANGVSKFHQGTLLSIWKKYEDICPIQSITNAQNFRYWSDPDLYSALNENDDTLLWKNKLAAKERLFELVADQNGEIYQKDILTIVFAKRFAGYKRADLLLRNMDRFERIVSNKERPVQIIWAGKPYPMDYTAIGTFDRIVNVCKTFTNCGVLVGYELRMAKLLKGGADVWINVPRLSHEASGTSGMAAAMNGAINVSIPDGWFPEFAKDKLNSFVIPPCDPGLPENLQDDADAESLYDVLENEVIPMYYDNASKWLSMVKSSMKDIIPEFDSGRLVDEYYKILYGNTKKESAINRMQHQESL